jgi:hypothetical protein
MQRSKWGLSAPVPMISPVFVAPYFFAERNILPLLGDWKMSCFTTTWDGMRTIGLEIADYYLEGILMGSAKAFACLREPLADDIARFFAADSAVTQLCLGTFQTKTG